MKKNIKKVTLESIYKNIVDNTYVLHLTGGYHYFSLCSPNKKIKNIYRQNIWPWIETLPTKKNLSNKTRYPRPTQRDSYPKLNLRVKKGKSYKINAFPTKTFYMHLIVAKAFILNNKNKPVVDHKNSMPSDYRIYNLEWVTYSENNKGKRPSIGPDKMYDVSSYRDSV